MPAPGGELTDLDTEARNPMRQHIRETNTNSSLLTFDDTDFDRALGLVSGNEGEELPTIARVIDHWHHRSHQALHTHSLSHVPGHGRYDTANKHGSICAAAG